MGKLKNAVLYVRKTNRENMKKYNNSKTRGNKPKRQLKRINIKQKEKCLIKVKKINIFYSDSRKHTKKVLIASCPKAKR